MGNFTACLRKLSAVERSASVTTKQIGISGSASVTTVAET